ncbi:Phospholipid phosphatase [Sergentomyia squamirostris]
MSSEKHIEQCRCVVIRSPSNIGYSTTSNEKQEGNFNFGYTIPELECNCSTNGAYKQPLQQVDQVNTLTIDKNFQPTSNFFIGIIRKMGIIALLLDFALCTFFILFIYMVETAIVPSNKRGFRCGDPSINFKYNGDTITDMLIVSSLFIMVIPIWICEAIKLRKISSSKIQWEQSMYRGIYWFNRLFIGVTLHQGVIEAMKTILGECRPHFMDTCRPDTGINCTLGEYISDFTCTNLDNSQGLVTDSYRSFPSGHAALGFYEGVFLAWYLQRSFPSSRSKWLIAVLQGLCLTWSSTCALTRITDNRHHWWDVLFGTIMGIIAAIYICAVVCCNFKTIKTCYTCKNEENLDSSTTHLKSDKQLLAMTIPDHKRVEMHSDTELLQIECQSAGSASSTPRFNGYKLQKI